MRMQCAVILLAWFGTVTGAGAQPFRIEEVSSIATLASGQLKAHTIYFADHRKDDIADPAAGGLTRFEDWARVRPVQKQFLSLFPEYEEPTLRGDTKRKLHIYVAEARFLLGRAPASIDLARYATLDFVQRIDPAVKHRLITASEVVPHNNSDDGSTHHPDRSWCEDGASVICTQSRYKFEGQLPAGILLVNKLREQSKKAIPDYLEFQSEIRLLTPAQQASIAQLTGLDGQLGGALEESIFWVNQVIQFGKFLAILQHDPAQPNMTIATVYLVLAIKTEVLNKQKDYGNVPILRNLVPAQVLMGNSSFNSGNSISAGLPKYARNRIVAIAEMIERD
jgi:hypothetical protein